MADRPRIDAPTLGDWRGWLKANHETSGAVWLILHKKGACDGAMTAAEASTEALCWGWIDSLPNKLDESRHLLLFAPRKGGSAWSKVNKERIETLMAEGRMQPAGRARIEAAKRDGSWSKLDAVEALEIPDDLAAAFRRHPPAAENFAGFPRSVKRAILEWIGAAKKAETRAKRLTETAELAAKNIRANQWRQPG